MNDERAEMNDRGEITGLGASWTCESYGSADHDYVTCPRCKANYRLWLIWIGAPVPAVMT